MKQLIIIEGPTASGKSKAALKLAEMFGTEIISADSRQVYRLMNIGTAKPDEEERKRVKHHLIDIISPDKDYSAGQFINDAETVINELTMQEKIPLICGGTMFYIKALLEGLFEAPEIPDSIRKEIEEMESARGTEYLYQMLSHIDPPTAEKLHPNDSYRIKRALEVWIATGVGISEHWDKQDKGVPRYNTFRILINDDRQTIYNRINQRMEKMIEDGLINEIKELLEAGYTENDPGMTSVGYREFIPYIRQNASFLECLEEAKKNTRNYAKRQITWYRNINFDRVINDPDGLHEDLPRMIMNRLEEKQKELS